MDCIINLLKPPGMTSNDCVTVTRRAIGQKHIGHMGTLDPAAAGVLPLGIGKAARLFDYAVRSPKVYVAEMTLGITTDTLDQQGKILSRSQVTASRSDVEALFSIFTGEIMQTPPAYSAVKVDGKPLYTLARKGEDITAAARKVTIYGIEYLYQSGEKQHVLRVTCGGGTYIRTLISDLGDRLGCGAHCSFLLREASCGLSINDAIDIHRLMAGEAVLLPPDEVLKHLRPYEINERTYIDIKHGRPIPFDQNNGYYRAYLNGIFIGILEAGEHGTARMRVSFI